MRVVVMGTGPFAVPTFRRLLESNHEIPALFTRPPRPVHGKSQEETNPMRALATARGLTVHDPQEINQPAERALLASCRPDVLVVCDYGQILAPATLEIARLGGVNLHASLLPKYRGAAPINWAIYHGEAETGVTVIHMTPRVDSGPTIAQAATPIGPDETAEELEPRLAEMGAPLVAQALAALESGAARPIEQDPRLASRAPRLKKEHGQVDWKRAGAEIVRQIRALQPWPKTFTFWQREGAGPVRLILDRARVVPGQALPPGTVLEASGDKLVVATGEQALAIDLIQPAGKRVLAAGEFLRGYPLRPGDRLGP